MQHSKAHSAELSAADELRSSLEETNTKFKHAQTALTNIKPKVVLQQRETEPLNDIRKSDQSVKELIS